MGGSNLEYRVHRESYPNIFVHRMNGKLEFVKVPYADGLFLFFNHFAGKYVRI